MRLTELERAEIAHNMEWKRAHAARLRRDGIEQGARVYDEAADRDQALLDEDAKEAQG
jgi:hypothetical protein